MHLLDCGNNFFFYLRKQQRSFDNEKKPKILSYNCFGLRKMHVAIKRDSLTKFYSQRGGGQPATYVRFFFRWGSEKFAKKKSKRLF